MSVSSNSAVEEAKKDAHVVYSKVVWVAKKGTEDDFLDASNYVFTSLRCMPWSQATMVSAQRSRAMSSMR